VDRGAGQSTIVQEIVQIIRGFLAIDEDDHPGRRHGQEQIKEALALLSLIDKEYLDKRTISKGFKDLAKPNLPSE